MSAPTRHTCGGPIFGRLAPAGECPRCDELHAGSKPRQGWGQRKREQEERDARSIRQHFDSEKHRSGGCGIVCTYGEW